MAFPDKNYTLGRGEIWFSQFREGTRFPLNGAEYIGNTPEVTLTTDTENLDHFDADHGVRTKDDSVLLEKNTTGSLITDNISPSNLARLFLGTSGVVTQVAAAAQTATITAVRKGRRYQLGVTAANPSGVRGISDVSIAATPAGGTSVTLVENLDYRVDSQTGGILFLSGGLVLTNDPDDDVVVTFDVDATSYNQVVSSANASSLEGELLYISFNPKGVRFDFLFPYVQLRPDGDFNLKGDEWQQISFAFEALKRDDNTEVVYSNGRPGIALDGTI